MENLAGFLQGISIEAIAMAIISEISPGIA
jgi:hypothetical protein